MDNLLLVHLIDGLCHLCRYILHQMLIQSSFINTLRKLIHLPTLILLQVLESSIQAWLEQKVQIVITHHGTLIFNYKLAFSELL